MSDDKPAHERILNAAKAHPWATITSVVTFAASLAALGPLFNYLSGFYYTRADADAWHEQVERRMAWNDVRDAETKAILARNLVNECRIKRSNKEAMSAMEQRVCDQYEQELIDAQRKFAAAQAKAIKLSGPKEEASK